MASSSSPTPTSSPLCPPSRGNRPTAPSCGSPSSRNTTATAQLATKTSTSPPSPGAPATATSSRHPSSKSIITSSASSEDAGSSPPPTSTPPSSRTPNCLRRSPTSPPARPTASPSARVYPLFLPGEPLAFNFEPYAPGNGWSSSDQLKIHVTSEDSAAPIDLTVSADSAQPITLAASASVGKGLHTVEATLLRDGKPLRIYRSGFWIRDWDYLLSGPKLTVGSDYFRARRQTPPRRRHHLHVERRRPPLPLQTKCLGLGSGHGADPRRGPQHDPQRPLVRLGPAASAPTAP